MKQPVSELRECFEKYLLKSAYIDLWSVAIIHQILGGSIWGHFRRRPGTQFCYALLD